MTYSLMRMTTNGDGWPGWGWHVTQVATVVAALGIALLIATWSRIATRQRGLLSLGLFVAVLLLSSNVQALSMSSYPSHMAEHIIVVLVIAPLVAGAVNFPLSRSVSTIVFFAFTILVPLFHLTPLGSWVMRYPEGHFVELVAFFVIGVGFWTPIYGGGSTFNDQQRITYTVLALPVIATTGLVLWSATASSLQSVGMDMSNVTIADVRDGGLVMMALGTTLMFAHVVGLCLRAATHQRALRVPVGLKYA